MIFRDRAQAAAMLAERLVDLRGRSPLVLAIPRGAVPMGRQLADALGGELDVVLVRKIGSPVNPEFAVGAVDEEGNVLVTQPGTPDAWLKPAARRELERIRTRRRQYSGERAAIDPSGRDVVVLDDGVATGATMLAALRSVRAHLPSRLVAAAAVAPPDTVTRLRELADEVVVLHTDPMFMAVGQYFADFSEVSDEQVIAALRGPVAAR